MSETTTVSENEALETIVDTLSTPSIPSLFARVYPRLGEADQALIHAWSELDSSESEIKRLGALPTTVSHTLTTTAGTAIKGSVQVNGRTEAKRTEFKQQIKRGKDQEIDNTTQEKANKRAKAIKHQCLGAMTKLANITYKRTEIADALEDEEAGIIAQSALNAGFSVAFSM